MAKSKAGAKQKPFDWDIVETCAMLESTEEFVAESLLRKFSQEINHKSIAAMIKRLQRRLKERFNCNYVQYRDKKIEGRRTHLRSKLWKAVDSGNVSAMIWLSKQYLGYTDKPKEDSEESNKWQVTPEQLATFMRGLVTDKPPDLPNDNTNTTNNSKSAG